MDSCQGGRCEAGGWFAAERGEGAGECGGGCEYVGDRRVGEGRRIQAHFLLDYVSTGRFGAVLLLDKLALVKTLLLEALLFQLVRTPELTLVLERGQVTGTDEKF